LTTRTFEGTNDAWNCISNDNNRKNLSDEEFEMAFSQTLGYYNCIDMLKNRWYRTEEQRQIILNQYMHNIDYADRFMKEADLKMHLTYEQEEYVKKLSFMKSRYCQEILLNDIKRVELTAKERQTALKTLINNGHLSQVWHKNITTVAEDKWILTAYEHKYSIYKTYLEASINYPEKHDLRYLAFNRTQKDAWYMYDLAQKNQLTEDEKVAIHFMYGAELSKGRTWDKFWDYCRAFSNCLTKKEQGRLIKKLQDRRYIQYVPLAQRTFKLDEKFQQILEGILVADRLRGKVV
jgi:hypothetical protein